MKVKIRSSRLVKPLYEGDPPPSRYIQLSVFDTVTYDQHVAVVYAYHPPTPSNATLELGLRKVLSTDYREFSGRLSQDGNGKPAIILNDKGVKFVEAFVDQPLDQIMLFKPSTSLLNLHPNLENVVELAQVQVTRFSCGSMVLGFSAHHFVADGHATSNFLVAWGQACRGVEIEPKPFCDRSMFHPRDPPLIEFEHRGAEYITKNFKQIYPLIDHGVEDIVSYKVHFNSEFISKIKAKACYLNGEMTKTFSTFESLVAHLWRAITKARGLTEVLETTQVRISVDGRSRLNPRIPKEFLGNLVLWAFARAQAKDLVQEPLSYAAKLIHESIINVNDGYFKSFIDFSNHKVKEEELVPNSDTKDLILWPNLEVHSWLRFPFCDLDFGCGGAYAFTPSFCPTEGLIYLLPSFVGDGSVEVSVPLFKENLTRFKEICYCVD